MLNKRDVLEAQLNSGDYSAFRFTYFNAAILMDHTYSQSAQCTISARNIVAFFCIFSSCL